MHLDIFSFWGQVGIEQKGFPLELVSNSRSLAGFLEIAQADKAKGSDDIADNLDIDGFGNGRRSSTHIHVQMILDRGRSRSRYRGYRGYRKGCSSGSRGEMKESGDCEKGRQQKGSHVVSLIIIIIIIRII
jgi:hypothetical protein